MAFTKRNGHSLRTSRAASGSGGADVSLGTSSTSNNLITAPIPRRDETLVTLAGKVLTTNFIRQSEESENALLDPPRSVPNPYGWMRDDKRENVEVLDHLKLENEYTTRITEHLSPLREELYEEMKGRMQETDYTTPAPDGNYFYYSRTEEGKSYSIYCRAPRTPENTDIVQNGKIDWDGKPETPILEGEVVYLDKNKLAEGHEYCSVGSISVSPSETKLAYSLDVIGGETYKLFIKDIESGEVTYHDEELEIDSTVVWGGDDSTLFYLKMDDAHRPFQVYKRLLETESEDEMIFEELDDLFWVGMGKSQDLKYLFISTDSSETSEVLYIDLKSPDDAESGLTTTVNMISKRRKKVLYEVEHRDGLFYISTNLDGTPNMRLMTAPVQPNNEDLWQDVLTETGDKLFDGGLTRALSDITPFRDHIVASGREGGLPRVWVLGDIASKNNTTQVNSVVQLEFTENPYDVGLGANYEFNSDVLLVGYDSLVTPTSTIQIPLLEPQNIEKRKILKKKNVLGYDPSLYQSERTWVTSRDGKTEIPVSLVYRKDTLEKNEGNDKQPVPTHLYGYGSYGSNIEADFRMTRLPLLDRGVVYVIAHVRGGGEMGRQWYEEPNGAKYLCKKNTFNDFVDVASWLINDRKITSPEMLSCEGRSAGGLLIGASINQAPELFKVAILGVPFVDVINTMIDSTIPLTACEWEEWGNPNEEKFFDYISSYSPMENVKTGAKYPACLLTGGLHDPRVQYWEPTKFAAALRHGQNQESGPVCLKLEMSAGHFSASDRYKYLKELAFDYAFLLDQLDLGFAKKQKKEFDDEEDA